LLLRYSYIITISIAAAASGLGIISKRLRGGKLKAALFLITAAAGVLLSTGFGYSDYPWTGIPAEKVMSVAATASGDSRKIAGGRFMLEAELHEACAKHGLRAEAGGRILLFFDSDPGILSGETFTAEARLSVPAEYRRVIEHQHAGDFSMLREQPVFIVYPAAETLNRTGWSSPVYRYRAGIVRILLDRCEELGPEAGGLFSALFMGNRDGLTEEETRIFRESGCSHILALSGMHLGILSGILLLILKPLPWKKPAFALSCLVIAAYLFLTGFGLSLVRAAVMYFLCGAAAASGRKFRGIDVLMLTFVILTAAEPASFYSAAFQLSFLAVAGILVLSPVVNRLLAARLPPVISMAVSASAGAQLFVIPLLAVLFGEIYPAGLFSGLLLAPMVTVFIWIGIIYLVSGAGIIAKAAGILYRLIFGVAGKAAALPAVKTEGAAIPLIVCTVLVCLLVCYSLYRRKTDGISG